MESIPAAEISRLRSRIGSVVNVNQPPYLSEITRDAVRHWTWGTGDRNPLYLDPAVARRAGHADVIGPPAMLYACSRLSVGYRGGLPGVHSAFGGSWWRWRQPLRLGAVIHPETVFTELSEMPSRFAGTMYKQVAVTRFRDQDGVDLAEVESWGLRYARRPVAKSGEGAAKPSERVEKLYDRARIDEITELYRVEAALACAPPDLRDLKVGDELPTIIRGPYSSTCAVVFEQAWGGSMVWAHGYWYDLLSRHPAISMRNEKGVPEPAEAVHWDPTMARRAGVADAYDYGPERVAWIATLLTTWGGPEAFLSQFYCEVRRFNLVGNVTTCRGRVAEVTRDVNETRIRVDVEATDQDGHRTAHGWAEVILRPTQGAARATPDPQRSHEERVQ